MNSVLDVRDGTHDSPKYLKTGIPFVTSKNLKNGHIDFSSCKLISLEDSKKFNLRSGVDNYDILFAMIGTIGNPTIVIKDREFSIKNVALFKNINRDHLSELWVQYVLESVTAKMKADAQGGLQPFVSLDFLRNYIMPIPPKNEQIRITSTVSKLNIYLGTINDNYKTLLSYKEYLKIKILELFFDDNSSYKSYYGKRTKTTLKELIPENMIGDGDWVLSDNMDPDGEYKLIQLKHIGNFKYVDKPYQSVNREFFLSNSCSEIKEGYLLINRLVADSMSVCIVPRLPFKTITAVDVCWVAPSDSYNQDYLMYYLMSTAFQSQMLLKCGGTTRKRISKNNLVNIPINIHPIECQKEIAGKIKYMFSVLDNIGN